MNAHLIHCTQATRSMKRAALYVRESFAFGQAWWWRRSNSRPTAA